MTQAETGVAHLSAKERPGRPPTQRLREGHGACSPRSLHGEHSPVGNLISDF